MKRISSLTILIAVFTAIFLLLSGCGDENSQEVRTGTTASGSDMDFFGLNTLTLGQLADSANLIAIGTVNRTVEEVPHETLKGVWKTRSAFHVEKSLKGDYEEEITIVQTGAAGKDDEPVFKDGDQCCLFLSKGADGIYRAVDKYGRFRIVEGRVSSVTPIQTGGENPPAGPFPSWEIAQE